MYIRLTDQPIHPEEIINQAKSPASGCVVTYVGLIRDNSHGKTVQSVEYRDSEGKAENGLRELAAEIQAKFPVNSLAMCHRTGLLKVGDINLVFAFACGHRQEGFDACEYAINQFKKALPTQKIETYQDGSICTEWD
jgi:molybdopterin synthase catalytic subunit